MSAAMAWCAYAVAISGLLASAAWVAEAAAREVGSATRWAWIGAMVLSVLLPVAAYFDAPVSGAGAMVPSGLVVTLSPVVASVGSGAEAGWSMDRWLLLLWGLSSLLAGLYVVRGVLWLRRARGRWRRAEIDGVPVWMTGDVGPAVFGVSGAILVPRWVLGLEQRVQRLLLLHEREHLRAGDPRMVLAAIAIVVLVPWNPVFWWMLARLRLAVEVDCDARVLRREPDARAYGSLLLELSRRRSRSPLLVAFAEPHRTLERRIRRITARRARHAVARAGVLGALGLAPLLVALVARDPLAARGMPMEEEPEALGGEPGANPFEGVDVLPAPGMGESERGSGEAAGVPAADVRQGGRAQAQDTLRPVFTPFTVSPRLRNAAEVSAALQANYPPLLRDAGIGGDVIVWFYIDAAGVVRRIQLKESSGHEALDAAAMRIAGIMDFTPALNRDQRVPVWVSIPIKFRSSTAPAVPLTRERPVVPAPPMARGDQGVRAAPTFTPFTRPPQVLNADEVARALQRYYPPLLRDAGISGTVHLWLFVETDGTVSRREIATSSGYDALDDAALRVAQDMRFSPAANRATTVAAWIQVPVTFSSR